MRDPGQALLLSSEDGVAWTYRDASAAAQLTCVAYGAGRFVAGTMAESTIVSTDGKEWWTGFEPDWSNALGITAVAYADDHFIASASGEFTTGWYISSLDGAAWTTQSWNVDDHLWVGDLIAFGNGPSGIVATGNTPYNNQPYLLHSTDHGSTWLDSIRRLPGFEPPVVFAGDRFFLRQQSDRSCTTYLSSTDGQRWEPLEVSENLRFELPAYGKGIWVAVGTNGTAVVSTNAIDWHLVATGDTNQLSNVSFTGGWFLATGLGGTLLASSNGTNWSRAAIETTNSLGAVVWSTGLFAVPEVSAGAVFTSQDLVTWTRRKPPVDTASSLLLYAWEEGFLAEVYPREYGSGQLLSSRDCLTWQMETPPMTEMGLVAVGGGKLLVFTGLGSRTFQFRSQGDTDWTTSALPWRARFNGFQLFGPWGAAFGLDTFLLTRLDGSILQSDPITDSAPRLSQPLVAVAATNNSIVTLSATALGSGPLHFQWKRNGTNLPGADLAFLGVSGGVVDAGAITVSVSNQFGAVESDPSSLVLAIPATLSISGDWDTLEIRGTPNGRYRIEYTQDLASSGPWLRFGELQLPSFAPTAWLNNVISLDPAASPQRFYRAVIGP